MILRNFAGAACVLSFSAGAAFAVEIAGGDVSLSYSSFLDDVAVDRTDETDSLDRLKLGGQVEVGFGSTFALQGDIAYHDFGGPRDDANTLTLHGIYHYDPSFAFGAFIGRDKGDDYDLGYYGIEIARDYIDFSVEAYLSDGDIDDLGSGVMLGVSGEYWLLPDLNIGASYDLANADNGIDGHRIAVQADYLFRPATSVFAEVGWAEIEFDGASSEETFIEIGAKYTFGREHGATFGMRGLANLLPGG
ncbi:putative porin [Palleronia sp. LCG004]|uniref:putative porin n=1 Tax=Palleronia sp. LCG004 TaxID=3079304 RepID=UPI002942423D|nr:putative porin [Palleronia sp. LCG004]WOI57287.1 hypothetical protein RVY76_05765 [Palleronia sp. LCG004]